MIHLKNVSLFSREKCAGDVDRRGMQMVEPPYIHIVPDSVYISSERLDRTDEFVTRVYIQGLYSYTLFDCSLVDTFLVHVVQTDR